MDLLKLLVVHIVFGLLNSTKPYNQTFANRWCVQAANILLTRIMRACVWIQIILLVGCMYSGRTKEFPRHFRFRILKS